MLAKLLSRFWWMILVRGVLAIAFGIILFTWPGTSLRWLILLFGVFALADGCGNVVNGIGGRHEHEQWWVLLIAGLAGAAVGALALFNPGATAILLLFYIAIWAIATGLLQIVAAIRLRKEIEGEFWMMLGGLASAVVGMFLMARPGEGAIAVLWIIAAYATASGVILVILAITARGFVKRIKATVSPQ